MTKNFITQFADDTKSLKPLSARFKELAIALPEDINQPILNKIAVKLQCQMLGMEQQTDATLIKHNGINKINSSTITKNIKKSADLITNTAVDTTSLDRNLINLSTLNQQSNEKGQQRGEIGTAKAVLDKLLQTQIADASVLVAITNEKRPKILLTRRANHLNSHAGEVSFAGGKHDKDDRNNVVTALREACEETALPPSKVQIIGQLPMQTSRSGMSVRPIVALIDAEVTYVPELGEIARIFWGDLETLITQPTDKYYFPFNYNGKQTTFETPCWIIDNETVWGLTGRIIASLLELAFDRNFNWYYVPVVQDDT